jgi:anti-anti-sigma factor
VTTEELFVVELRELPLAALNRASEHNLTLMRELALIHNADEQGAAPARLLWLSQHLDQQYAAFNAEPQERLQKAIEGDVEHIDIRYQVPGHAAVAAIELGAALDEVDEYCSSGDLLTLVTPPESLAVRRWLLGEFVAQIRDGAEPTRWSDRPTVEAIAAQPSGAAGELSGTGTAGTFAVDEDLDLEGAARMRGDFAHMIESGVLHLTVDLQSCSFIDSVGISLLLTTRERLQRSGGAIVITNATGATKRTLQTTGVYDILTTGT